MGDKVELLRRRNYSINKVNFIRQSLAGYGGGSAIASEMVQNADDADADRISFHFRNNSLVVRNSSVFSERDFESITDIAKGEKAPEEGKIGTWGTGFLSVFHITDAPELLSSGEHITFDPTEDEVLVFGTDIKNYTEFRLPWRRHETELSRKLEADIWRKEDISHLRDQLTVDIYRLILFLRNVRIIEVYEGDTTEKIIARVERRLVDEPKSSGFACEKWEIDYKRAGVQPRTDTWLYYRGHVPWDKRSMGVTIKDTEIVLAFPFESRDWLVQNVPGSLYNFLPTPIQTGLPFHINGAFFPDNNRQGILLDPNTQRDKSDWNKRVLQELGQLFARIVLDIRDQVSEPRRFYELLPVSLPKRSFLEPVRQPFIQIASDLPIVKTSLGSWERPGRVFIGRRGSRLPDLAADYLPILPTGIPQEFRDFLEKYLEIPTLKIKHILNHIKHELKPGILLDSAHPMINNREKMEILYGEISGPVPESIPDLVDYAICLTEDQTLWPFNEVWWADKSTRRLLAGTDIRFVDNRIQQKFRGWRGSLVGEFNGAKLVEWLGEQDWPEAGLLNTGFVKQLRQISNQLSKWFQPASAAREQDSAPLTMAQPPSFIRDTKHLADVLKFIAKDLQYADEKILSRLPLVRSETDYLLYPGQLYRHNDSNERNLLKNLDIHFVYAEWGEDREIWSVYDKAGVKYLDPSDVIEALEKTTARWTENPDDELLEYLLSLYQYFERCRLGEKDKNRLRHLPLCVTQNGHLVPAQGGKVIPHLPSDQNSQIDQRIRQHLDNLQLDNLIHSQLIVHGKRFLTNILQVETLSPSRLIETVIVPYYRDPRLDDSARQDLLRYISEQLRNMSESQQRALFPKLLDKPLIRCTDGEYRPARSVYFASPALDAVFANGYYKLHTNYGVPVAEVDDADQRPYRHSTWHWLFDLLGVNEHPASGDLVHAVQTVVEAGPPTKTRVEAVRRVYEMLNREISKEQLKIDSELKKLTKFAWLPAQNDDAQWYHPKDLYQASHTDFVGDQAPLLRFGESAILLRNFLGMPKFPPVGIVAKHLLASSVQNAEMKRQGQIYEYLGNRWKNLDNEIRTRLKNEPVVWGGERFWLAKHVFLGNYSQKFGHRRCYLKPPGGDAQKFLEQLGVRPIPHPWKDSIALLKEIAGEYSENSVIKDDDRRLLLSNFDHLGRLLQSEGKENPADMDLLRHLTIVPDQNGILRLPSRVVIADKPELLDQFDPDDIPVVDEADLTEAGYYFLQRLQTLMLSRVVYRRAVNTKGSHEDTKLSFRIRNLTESFQRIALFIQEEIGKQFQEALPKEKLEHVKIWKTPRLDVEYNLSNGLGWVVKGHRRSDNALYDVELNYLYVRMGKNGKEPILPLAYELNNILFPKSNQIPLIEQLLVIPPAQADNYLTERGFRRLYEDRIEQAEVSQNDLVNLTDTEGGSSPWEEEENVIEEPVTGQASAQDFFEHKIDADATNSGNFTVTASESDGGKPKQKLVPLPEDTSPALEADEESKIGEIETIPRFTGQRRPPVPVLPNNYGELNKKFGLERRIDEIGETDAVISDTTWDSSRGSRSGNGSGQVYQVRFTLTFTNRYQGFLPLHQRAQNMLTNHPARLECKTDFEDWSFELYVDYQEGVIYNQRVLSQFFEAYNIPAGGIVYLELLHTNVVRLFWKPVSSSVQKVKCLELLEDGTVDEYEIPSAEFPCEISEYVLRAEKRLEDPEALFKQALDKRGIFQTICEVFGAPERELSYDEIYREVMNQRMVAKASIDYQLNQRPCFVPVGSDCWRFEPNRGSEPNQKSDYRQPNPDDEILPGSMTTTERPEEDLQPPLSTSSRSPYHQLVENIRQEWVKLEDLFQLNGHDPLQQLEQLAQDLLALGQRLEADLSALTHNQLVEDDLLTILWQQFLQAPQNLDAQQNLQRYLVEQIRKTKDFIGQIEYQLANTPYEQRDFAFPTLSRLAGQMAERGQITIARQLYTVLKEQNAGDFEKALAQLAQADDVNAYIQLVEVAKTEDERWQMWRDAWQKYPGFPTLRRAIQKDVKSMVDEVIQIIDANLAQGKSQNAFDSFLTLLGQINPFVNAWQTAQSTSSLIGGLGQRLFEVFQGNENYRRALQVVAILPPETSWNFSGDIYLEAIQGVVREFENQADSLSAAALGEYGLYLVGKYHWLTDDYVFSKAFAKVSRLYENLAMPHRAYAYIKQAQGKATGERKTNLGHRAYALNKHRSNTEEQVEKQNWRVQVEALLQNPDFYEVVSIEEFRLFCGQ